MTTDNTECPFCLGTYARGNRYVCPTCECGHVRDEHQFSGEACAVDGCPCIAFEEARDR